MKGSSLTMTADLRKETGSKLSPVSRLRRMKYMQMKKTTARIAIPPATPPITAPMLMLPVPDTGAEDDMVAPGAVVMACMLVSRSPAGVWANAVVLVVVPVVPIVVLELLEEREDEVFRTLAEVVDEDDVVVMVDFEVVVVVVVDVVEVEELDELCPWCWPLSPPPPPL